MSITWRIERVRIEGYIFRKSLLGKQILQVVEVFRRFDTDCATQCEPEYTEVRDAAPN